MTTKSLEFGADELVNHCIKQCLTPQCKVDKKIFPAEGGIGNAYISNAVANSNGILGFDKGTVIECSLATLAKDGNKVTPVCFEFNAARTYNIDPEWVGREAAKLSISALKTKPIETKNTKLILTQFALQDLLRLHAD